MTLRTPDTLRHGIELLVDDVGPLHAISLLGFADGDPAKVDENLARAREAVDATWLDLRDADDKEAAKALQERVGGSLLVLLVRASNMPVALALFLRQAVDEKRDVDLGSGRATTRPAHQSIIVIAEDCTDYGTAPFELQRIPYWYLDRQIDRPM